MDNKQLLGSPLYPFISKVQQSCFSKDPFEDLLVGLNESYDLQCEQSDSQWYSYILITAKGKSCRPEVDELKSLWESERGNFGLYVGITSDYEFRHEHLGNPNSPIQGDMTPTSSVFLLHSHLHPDIKQARRFEAIALLIFGGKINLANLRGRCNEFRLLNRKMEQMGLTVDKEACQKCAIEFLKSGKDVILFNDDEAPEHPGGVIFTGRYKIIRRVQ